MAIIMLSRGSYTRGREVAEKTAQELGYHCLSRETLLKGSENFNVAEIKLLRAFEDAPAFFDRFTHNKGEYIAYIQDALLNRLKEDNVVYHGFVFHHFIKDIPEVLKVRIISGLEDRVQNLMTREKISRKKSFRLIQKVDEQRKKWGRKLYGIDPEDPALYDLVLQIDKLTVENAVSAICRTAGLKQFRTTPESKKTLEDLALAAEIKTYLVDVKPNVGICIENGFASLQVDASLAKRLDLVSRIGEIMKMIPRLKGIKIGTEGHPDDKAVCLPEPSIKSTRDTAQTIFTELG